MKNVIPRVAAVHDISGFGKVSLTEAIPIMSVMGIEVCPLPTAVLSTHTYEFKNYTFHDLTGEMVNIINHWKELGLEFDAIYSGYMGSKQQIDILIDFIDKFKTDNLLVVVDPVLGDNALLDVKTVYSERMKDLVGGMKKLIRYADVITPNLTEACLLLDEEYPSNYITYDEAKSYLKRLSDMGAKKVAITSVMASDNEMYVAVYDRDEDKYWKVDCGYVNRPFHGTGDIYTSVLTGALLKGQSMIEAAKLASDFVRCAIEETIKHPQIEIKNGVLFEKVLAGFFSE